MDAGTRIRRTARRHGWTEEPVNILGYFNLRLVRPEPGGGRSHVMIRRFGQRIIDLHCHIGDDFRSLTMPSARQVEEILAARSGEGAEDAEKD